MITAFEALRVRRFAPATLAARRRNLVVLRAFLAEIEVADVREVTRENIAAFQRWLIARHYTDHTRCAHLAPARAFFAHLERTDGILVDPCASLVLPRLTHRLPRGVLTLDEARRILDAPDVQTRAACEIKPSSKSYTRPVCGCRNWRG